MHPGDRILQMIHTQVAQRDTIISYEKRSAVVAPSTEPITDDRVDFTPDGAAFIA